MTVVSGTAGGSALEPLSGLDSAFLALETATSRPYVAGVLVLEPPAEGTAWDGPAFFERIRALIAARTVLVPRLGRRVVRMPLDLLPPAWVEDPAFDVDAHVRRAALPSPGGRRELEAFLGEIMGRPLPPDRPLWEMVVVEGMAGGRAAVVARLHHAVLDGVSGATAMAAFLDLEPEPDTRSGPPGPPSAPSATVRPPTPDAAGLLRYVASSVARQPDVARDALHRSLGAMVALAEQNRRLAAEGRTPPPPPFRAPRTSLNGSVTAERTVATLTVPLADLEEVRAACGGSVTVNDVILCAVGDAATRLLGQRGETPDDPLVALVPVSTRGPATVPDDGSAAHVGNAISGMLVPLPVQAPDPFERLRAVAQAAQVAKEQEERAGGDLLEGLTRAVPLVFLRAAMRGIDRFRLFDRVPPPCNLVISTVVVPDVTLWWAGREVSAVYPLGPVVGGVGLNVTAMTYRGAVSLGLAACPRQVPDVAGFARLLETCVRDLVRRAASVVGG